jgi:hypothetical protein
VTSGEVRSVTLELSPQAPGGPIAPPADA